MDKLNKIHKAFTAILSIETVIILVLTYILLT